MLFFDLLHLTDGLKLFTCPLEMITRSSKYRFHVRSWRIRFPCFLSSPGCLIFTYNQFFTCFETTWPRLSVIWERNRCNFHHVLMFHSSSHVHEVICALTSVIYYSWRAVIFVASGILSITSFCFSRHSVWPVIGTRYLWPLNHSLNPFVAI